MNFLTLKLNTCYSIALFLCCFTVIVKAQNSNAIKITPPVSITVECNNIAIITRPIATTTCSGGKVNFSFSEIKTNGSCTDNYTLTRTWKATDACNNSATAVQKITVQDRRAPMIGTLANVTVECNNIPAVVKPIVADNCAKVIDLKMFDTKENGLCGDSYKIIRQWVATDNCANKSTRTQIISVLDRIKPAFSNIPQNVTVECTAIPAAVNPLTSDNCDSQVDVVLKETKQGSSIVGGVCSYILKREWTAVDNCGNSNQATQLITIRDTKAPKFTSTLANITVSCNQIPQASAPAAIDNCTAKVDIKLKESILNGNCPDNYAIKREWTASDDCGNIITATQNIIVQDKLAPSIFGVPSNITMSCSQLVPASSKSVTALDNCDKEIAISFKETKINGTCADNYVIKREWIATDNCANKTTRIQNITLRDNVAPNFTTIPQNPTVDCAKIPAAANIAAVDNCDKQVEISFKETKIAGTCANTYLLNRTWTATDNCNNTKSISQIITVQDKIAPKLVGVPANLTLGCKDDIPNTTVTATDNCSTNVNVILDERINIQGCTKIITRVWTATDDCANISVATQTITIEDKEPPYPIATPPATITIACGAEIPVAAALMFKDKCTESVTVSYSEEIVNSENPACPKAKIIRRWTAKDTCGNATVITQTVLIGAQVTNRESQAITTIIAQDNKSDIGLLSQSELAYPNPTDGVLFINLLEKADEIKLSDELGRIIYQKEKLQSGILNIDLNNYDNGVYHLQVKTGETQKTQRVVLLKH